MEAKEERKSIARSISKLDEEITNKIAAGEVVVRPSAALKELLENSIDAGSKNINISCREGGLQTLQIQDDGHGIKVEDFPILCERFTTSKIEKYQDLAKVASFGFRGEALASISLEGKLEITSRTADQEVAYKGYFENCRLVGKNGAPDESPIACAGNFGTQIKANDLFYNNKQRKLSFKKKEEFMRIVNVVMNYSLHYCMINFTCKALESNNTPVSTVNINREGKTKNDVRKILIQRLFGGIKQSDLFDITEEFSFSDLKVEIVCSKANAKNSIKKNTLVLFINNRLVKCERVKKGIDTAYHAYLPQGHHYFVYLSLEMNPRDLDVNVHPTKKEVGFENQDEISDAIAELLEKHLSQQNESINFGDPDKGKKMKTPTADKLMPKPKSKKKSPPKEDPEEDAKFTQEEDDRDLDHEEIVELTPTVDKTKKKEQRKTIRIDHRDTTLDHFIMHGKLDSDIHKVEACGKEYDRGTSSQQDELIDTPNNVMNLNTVVSCNLLSVRKLIYEFEQDVDEDYAKMFKTHSYVGMINYDQVLFQYDTILLLANFRPLMKEYVYQQALYNFQNLGKFNFTEPLCLKELLMAGLEFPGINYCETEHMDKEELAERYLKKYNTPMIGDGRSDSGVPMLKDMLEEYFSIVIKDNKLCSLPKIVREIPPYIDYLPVLMIKLIATIDYNEEIKCFKKICELLGDYYSRFIYYHALNTDQAEEDPEKISSVEFIIRNILLPRLKKSLKVRSKFGSEGDETFTTLTCLENLYQVFERCE
ncbi:unnamed protein product [Moneuplotes crassus]|uniref:DNA mismatch repair protein S5 domain-containing protein n=1 Tax=Euplotes crassus TaxID=5936 RepID=A0AAD1Y7A4_EUPCR|nr:unnamed protein product [Moneuplotes crassus]